MVQKDYIMRMIEQFAAVLMKIVFNKENKHFDTALLEIDTAYRNLTGFDPQDIKNMSEQDIVADLSAGDYLDVDRCLIIAELLREEGEMKEMQQLEPSSLFFKALYLYLQAIQYIDHSYQMKYAAHVDKLVEKFSDIELPDHYQFALFQYDEMMNRFAKAEDMLFELMEKNYPEIQTKGVEFYNRLLAKSDAELEQGNLPRDEVEEGLQQIQK